MNPLTMVKQTQRINAKYKDSAYVYVGRLPYDLTEGDLLAVFAQYGEVVDVKLVRDQGTGKSKGFAFVAYDDMKISELLILLLVLGRIIKVEHRGEYLKREEEADETKEKKGESRGVCRAFHRMECTRGGDSCKFSHDENRAANTGWGDEDR